MRQTKWKQTKKRNTTTKEKTVIRDETDIWTGNKNLTRLFEGWLYAFKLNKN